MTDAIKLPARYEVVRVAYDSKGNALCPEDEDAERGHVDVVYEPRLFEAFRTRGTKKEAIRACQRHREAIIADQRAQDMVDAADSEERLPSTGRECCDQAARYWRAQYQAEANENTTIRKVVGLATDDPDQTITAAEVQRRLHAAEKLAQREVQAAMTALAVNEENEARADEAQRSRDIAVDTAARNMRQREDAEAERDKALDALAKAWRLFEESGVMRELDGRTGNETLNELGSHLDHWASRLPGDAKPK